jgi:leucyl aminopeptidase
VPGFVQVTATTKPVSDVDADTVALCLLEGEEPPASSPGEVRELLSSEEAKRSFKALGLAHAEGRRWLLLGLGARDKLTPERARAAAAVLHPRALEVSARTLCVQAPANSGARIAAALTEGLVLSDYRFEQFRSQGSEQPDREGAGERAAPKHVERLVLAAGDVDSAELKASVDAAALVAGAANAARDLQNRPGNDLTPSALAEYAQTLAEQIASLSVETEARAGIVARGMGAFAAVAQGSEQEPALIVLRYEPPGGAREDTPTLGLVGKAVTFDSGGISLKPGPKMAEMKFDMSGGAAVIESIAAIARLELPLSVVAVVGATENLPSGRSVKPGDIVVAANGKTIEVNNTDAEGRLVLADCLCRAVELGAEQIIDLATLTGAVIIALGSTYSGLMSNDEAFARRILDAGSRTGETAWRLPLHEEYDELIKGTYGDLDNAPEGRKAGTIVGGSFLRNFVGDTPWAHLDIAGSAWDLGRAYAPKGASGYGVRLLVELARSYCA